ncbi:Transmembrane protein 107 [Portunus trituberculatus]|uniref:Transmembrane protein 107 n=1 Tax=Portunus trituberculatus TaxID=210409 RepID=A0A5B7E0L1_PORTR|nr:Transmembrane protein 107 [Portunus trituberculatus]
MPGQSFMSFPSLAFLILSTRTPASFQSNPVACGKCHTPAILIYHIYTEDQRPTMRVTGLIPARFLTLTSHLVLLVTILMAREENVLACLPVEYSSSEYSLRDGEFLGGLVAGIALTALELIGFITAIACHSGASVSLAYLVLDSWDCQLYWWVFALTSVLPALVEVGVMVNVLMLKKNV